MERKPSATLTQPKVRIPNEEEVLVTKGSKMSRNKSQAKRRRRRRHVPKYWVTLGMGALVAYGAFDTRVLVPAASARDLGAIHDSAAPPTGLRFDIPAGPLDVALDAFRAVTGWRVVVVKDDINAISTPGVIGTFTAQAALDRLLSGTGVGYRFVGAREVALEVAGPNAAIDVVGGPAPLSSDKYTEPLRDVPQTITVISKEVIEEQGATTLRDVLRNVPGLTISAGEGGTPAGDNLTLRGFSARNDIFVDGARDLGPQSRDPFNLEQVEVTKGPDSAHSGRGAAAGMINLVSKSPLLSSAYGFTLNLGTDRTKRLTGDISVPLARIGAGEHTAARLNFVLHESGVAGRDVVEYRRWGIAPSIAFGLGTPTRVTFSYYKLNQDNISDYGIPWVPSTNTALTDYQDQPAPVPRSTFYGFRDRDHEKLTSDIATAKVEHDFGDTFTLRSQLRFGRSTRDSIATPPRFASNDSTVINREMRSWLTADDIWDDQTDLTGRFRTGTVGHAVVAGLAVTREDNERRTRTADTVTTTLLNPNPDDPFTGEITDGAIVANVVGDSVAAYAFDTISLGRMVQLSGGARYDYFDAGGRDLTGKDVAHIDRMLSWRGGIVFKPRTSGSIYATYATSLSPSLEGLTYGTGDVALKPEKTYTFEAGTKWEVFRDRILLSLAGFRVDKTNARTPALVAGGPTQVLDGEQRVLGAEVSASGRIRRAWNLLVGYTFLDSKILRSNTGIAPSIFPTLPDEGHSLQNTPKHSANVWTTYETPWRLSVGAGMRLVDERFGNNANTRRVPSYWTADAMASCPVGDRVDLRLNLYNLNNAYYFDRLGGGHLIPGPSRSANVSVGFKF